MSEGLREIMLKWALKNALDHDGRAVRGPVISKVLAEKPELKAQVSKIIPELDEIIEEVNSMSLDEQRNMLSSIAPNLLIKKKVKEVKELPPLQGAKVGKVVMRLPPEPSGYMHIGHGMSAVLNYTYVKKYEGRLWLRFEDTDPRKVKKEYYDSFKKGYRWLGIEWDDEKNNSDDMELYYKLCEKLLRDKHAYACICDVNSIRKNRSIGAECAHRNLSPLENLEIWSKMLSGDYSEGDVVIRLKGDMKNDNTTLRDPILFRIVDYPHPLLGKDYKVWPTYDFAVAIEDAICGVTHVLRTSEFMLRNELQDYIRNLLGMENPFYIQYSRFEFKGTPVAKREIRDLIQRGAIKGWDDPRLATIEGIKRRGILPEAIREFTLTHTGFTYAKREYTWDLLYAVNRKILDPIAKRFFFVPEPVKLKVKQAPKMVAKIPLHPEKDYGYRNIETNGEFFISAKDLTHASLGHIIRLKHLYNIKVEGFKNNIAVASFIGTELLQDVKIIQWVTEDCLKVSVTIPDVLFKEDKFNEGSLVTIKGLGEKALSGLEVGERIQFERFGFCILDKKGRELEFIFIHT